MLTPDLLHDYQKHAVNFQCTHRETMLWLDMGLGKLQPNSEPVLTPDGWTTMGQLQPDDYVIGSNGEPTRVLATFPQGEQEVVKVTFTDGSWCHVGWDHLWYVQNPNQKSRGQVGHVMTTRQLVDTKLTRPSGQRGEDAYWHIPMVDPVQFPEKELPIDPYLLGVILGDGTITEGGSVTICTDIEIIDKVGARFLRGHDSCDYVGYGSILGVTQVMRDLGLAGKRSWEKLVPVEYLHTSVGQRLALLQGLLDSDGSPIDKGGVEFSSTSEALIDAVVELVQSLGGIAKKKGPRVTFYQGGEGKPSWRVNVKLPPQLDPFRLRRKLKKWIRPSKYPPIRKMVSAEVVGRENSTCIKVAAPDSLYVTRNYIVTHNTVITLTGIAHLINTGYLNAVIIVAPIRVIRLVWRQEALKWSHTKHLTFSMVMGTPDQRTRALMRPANIYLVNYENLKWLSQTLQTYYIKRGRPLPANGLVWDEISKMKNSSTQRVRAVAKILPEFKWITGLTGSPASNGYKDLHGQYLVVDKGQRLGVAKQAFESRFYKKTGDYGKEPYEGAEDEIKQLIGDITLEMSEKDYNPLPDLIVNDVKLDLPDRLRARYDQMEKDFFLLLDSGTEVDVFNKASLMNKCLQFANGAVYPVAGMPLWEHVHDIKMEALADIIDEAQGQPVLCSYAYRSDAERIMERFKDIRPINLTACKTDAALNNAMDRWKRGDCRLMIGHPACLGGDTEVLTESRGWVKIVNVEQTDRVYDGVEFVSHDGCSYSGFKNVIDVFGISMTPDHKLLVDGQWVRADNVQDTGRFRDEALRFGEETAHYLSSRVSELRVSSGNAQTERGEKQQAQTESLLSLYSANFPQDDWQSDLENLAGDGLAIAKHFGQKLRWSWNHCMLRMAELQKLLQRYVRNISRWANHRKGRCKQALLKSELCMGIQHGATVEQADQPVRSVSRREDTSCRVVSAYRVQQDDVDDATKSRNDGRRSSSGRHEFTLREKQKSISSQAQRKAHVYDLVNCGPRHRFVIRNNEGCVFISHNSMGHGVDGLQDRGHIITWFGLTWSLDLYDQMNARIRRQGQGAPVICHRIMIDNTVDNIQQMALREKAHTQTQLRSVIKEYRLLKGI